MAAASWSRWWPMPFEILIDRALAWRDRLLAGDRFQRFAVAFPPTRIIANRCAAELFDICAGFVYSQVLYACVRTKVFERLRDGPQSVAALAAHMALPVDAAATLLDAAAGLRLLEKRSDGRYGLGLLGASALANPGIGAMVEHHAMLYRDLADPLALLRGVAGPTELNRYWSYARQDRSDDAAAAETTAAYTALMSASQPMIAREVIAAYPFARHRTLLDVGGGDGAFLSAVAQAAPDLRLTLFDLPPVAQEARARFAREGLSDRAGAVGGSFLTDALPRGADIITLVRVIHDHDEAAVTTLLRAARAALDPGGVLLVAEPMAGMAATRRAGNAYFGLYLKAMGQGRVRSQNDLHRLLLSCGFSHVAALKTRMPMLTSALIATV